jgi:hypothetical protein
MLTVTVMSGKAPSPVAAGATVVVGKSSSLPPDWYGAEVGTNVAVVVVGTIVVMIVVGDVVGTVVGGVVTGTVVYVNPFVRVPAWVSGLVTTTSTAPAAWAGVMAVIDVALSTLTPVAASPPKVTVAPVTNPVPVMVTEVPPAGRPAVGATEVTAGAAM